MTKLLVVDDEKQIREVIREYAEFEGLEVVEAGDGMEAVHICREEDFDLIVLDVMMPKLDGFSTCKEIKKLKDIPTIMLSARGEEYDKLFGFEMGVDDYLVKPFSPKELMARIHAVLKRNAHSAVEPQAKPIEIDELKIDTLGRNVFIAGSKIDLTPKEFDLLIYLVTNQNIALTRDKILSAVWGYDFFGDDRTVDTHIKVLRNNLGRMRDKIVTVRGIGYKFEL